MYTYYGYVMRPKNEEIRTMKIRLNDYVLLAVWRLFALAALAYIPACAIAAQAYPPLKIDLNTQRIDGTDGYYVLGRTAVPDNRNAGFTANAGFVVTSEGVVVFDALGTPALGKALIAAVRERTSQPIRYVVVSHYHADHIYGLQAFRDETSALIIAQHKAWNYKGSLDAGKRLRQREQSLAPWVNDATRVIQPDLTFENDIVFKLGGKTFRVVYAGPAHAPDDSMMLVNPGGVLFAGDIVQNHRIPFMNSEEVNTSNWLAGLSKVLEMKPSHIIAGHGEPSDDPKAAIEFTENYIRFVRAQMKAAVQNWQPFEEAYQSVDWSRYSSMPAFEQTNRGNAYRVYLDMESSLLDDTDGASK
jgi:glyoxylase-like metal-dependent hydrolase (beta-lactamase superfamily II)